jgi:hypothetical protein
MWVDSDSFDLQYWHLFCLQDLGLDPISSFSNASWRRDLR